MKIGVYALCKNEEKHAHAWAESCREADVRVVTDTGSTDSTVIWLRQCGVEVVHGYVCPWRWDDGHNLSLNHLPPDIDIAIRLDLDERLQPGWREAVEKAWTGNVNNLRYRYAWSLRPDGSPGLEFLCDRVHSRSGFRWAQATHEGLMCWVGPKVQAYAEGLRIDHHRDQGKVHKSDLMLLRVAVRESPLDARARWYLAREMDYMGMPEAAAEFLAYLKMDGGQITERSYARRVLYRLTGDEQQLHKATVECPGEPDAWERLALVRYHQKDWPECLRLAEAAINSGDPLTHACDPDSRGRAYDLAAVASWELGSRPQALAYARQAATLMPTDPRLRANVEAMERACELHPRAGAGVG